MAVTAAAICTNCIAVASAERSAALAPFQRHQVGQSPAQNVNWADSSLASAYQFGGSIAKCATNAVTTA